MKKLCWIVFCIIMVSGAHAREPVPADTLSAKIQRSFHDQFLAPDKGHHFMASAFVAGASFYALRGEANVTEQSANKAAFAISFSVGLAKELYDGLSGHGTPSAKDLVADVLGIGVALLVLNLPKE